MSVVVSTVVDLGRGLLSRYAAVIYGMVGRLWLIVTGPVTIIVLASHFSPAAQGYFFTFMSLAAARTVAELGLGQVIIVKVAPLCHSALSTPEVVPPHVAGLIRFAALWFAGAGAVIAVALYLGGTLLLSASHGLPTVDWFPQWAALSGLVGLDVALSGLLFPLEGAGQVRAVYYCRMVRSFVNSLVLWISILLGLELWSIGIALACSLLWTTYFLFAKGRLVVQALRPGATVAKINWFSEVFPAQWRLALSSFAEYISFYTVVPLMYVMHGAVIAGQLGVTWQLAAAVEAVSGAIVATRFPEFSRLAGARAIRELDRLFLSTSFISMGLCLVGALSVGIAVLIFERTGLNIASRILPFDQVAILMLGVMLWHTNLAIVAYLRAHGGDPYLPASLGSAALLLAANLTLGRWFGPPGLLWGYTITGLCIVPLGFYLLRRKRRTCGYPPFKIRGGWVTLP